VPIVIGTGHIGTAILAEIASAITPAITSATRLAARPKPLVAPNVSIKTLFVMAVAIPRPSICLGNFCTSEAFFASQNSLLT
jgi:hypothetical protein